MTDSVHEEVLLRKSEEQGETLKASKMARPRAGSSPTSRWAEDTLWRTVPENLPVNLAFLGATDSDQKPEITRGFSTSEAVKANRPCDSSNTRLVVKLNEKPPVSQRVSAGKAG